MKLKCDNRFKCKFQRKPSLNLSRNLSVSLLHGKKKLVVTRIPSMLGHKKAKYVCVERSGYFITFKISSEGSV